MSVADFFRSYLFAYLFVLGLSLGAWAILMLHEVTGGRWGLPLRVPLMAATRLIPLTGILFIPLFFGLPVLYPWEHSHDPAKAWWLNVPFFVVRTAIYFVLWGVLSKLWWRIAARSTGARPPALRTLSAAGLIVYGLTISAAAVDWVMSLVPAWHSTTFGLLIAISQMLAGMALGVAACAWFTSKPSNASFHDFGNLLLTFVMTWAYLAFTQYLIIWAEDLPNEIVWLVPRVQTSWRWLALSVLLLLFVLPFALLLFRIVKRTSQAIGTLALVLLAGTLLFDFYLISPALEPQGFRLTPSDPLAAIALGGLWFTAWLRKLRT